MALAETVQARECKFIATPDQLKRLAGLPNLYRLPRIYSLPDKLIVVEYFFDTPELELFGHGAQLRADQLVERVEPEVVFKGIREGKGAEFVRSERRDHYPWQAVHAALKGERDLPPVALARELVGEASLQNVLRAQKRRRRLTFSNGDDQFQVRIDLDTIRYSSPHGTEFRKDHEVELKAGDGISDDELRDVVFGMQLEFGLKPSPSPKYQRGMRMFGLG